MTRLIHRGRIRDSKPCQKELSERDEWARACLLVQREAIRRGDEGLAHFAGCVGFGCFYEESGK